LPSTVTTPRSKNAANPNALPVRFWHCKQWHKEMEEGSPTHLTESWPQAQVASRVFMLSLRAV